MIRENADGNKNKNPCARDDIRDVLAKYTNDDVLLFLTSLIDTKTREPARPIGTATITEKLMPPEWIRPGERFRIERHSDDTVCDDIGTRHRFDYVLVGNTPVRYIKYPSMTDPDPAFQATLFNFTDLALAAGYKSVAAMRFVTKHTHILAVPGLAVGGGGGGGTKYLTYSGALAMMQSPRCRRSLPEAYDQLRNMLDARLTVTDACIELPELGTVMDELIDTLARICDSMTSGEYVTDLVFDYYLDYDMTSTTRRLATMGVETPVVGST
jgi:hypothetical protein